MGDLTHIGEAGEARMVDISGKRATVRRARARGRVLLRPATVAKIAGGALAKGNALEAARLAGILAAKRTAELIPLCHPIPLDWIDVRIELGEAEAAIEAAVKTRAPTGAEMEALVAVAVAALTLYDMVKAVDREAQITDISLVEKSGGRSGHWIKCQVPSDPQRPSLDTGHLTLDTRFGRVVSVNLSRRKGVPKRPVQEAEFRADHGVVGDAHAGKGDRQVSLLAQESIDRQRAVFAARRGQGGAGVPASQGRLAHCIKGCDAAAHLGPGSFAENLTIEGLPLAELPIGTCLRVGDAVVLEISKIGKECHTRCAIYQRLGDCVMPREGVFARVLVGGTVRPNDRVEMLDA